MRIATVSIALFVALTSSQAIAQGVVTPSISPAYIGDCHLVVTVSALMAAVDVEVQLNGHRLTRQSISPPSGSIVVVLNGPLQEGDEARARAGDGPWKVEPVTRRVPPVAPECDGPTPPTLDDRGSFEASGYYGRAFDNFSAGSLDAYLDPEKAVPGTSQRWIAGTNVEYRLYRRKSSDVQVWLAARTMHALRTTDIDCTKRDSPLCDDKRISAERYLAVLEGATSFEAYFEPRIELKTINGDSDFPVKVYLSWRVGFTHLAKGPKVFEEDAIGAGLLVPVGPFAGSFANLGWGRTGVIDSNPERNRTKIDARLSFSLVPGWVDRINVFKRMAGATRGFVETRIDQNAGGDAPDSVRTFVGLSFDFRTAFAQ